MNETRRTLHARLQSGEEHPVLNAPSSSSSFFSTVRLHARINRSQLTQLFSSPRLTYIIRSIRVARDILRYTWKKVLRFSRKRNRKDFSFSSLSLLLFVHSSETRETPDLFPSADDWIFFVGVCRLRFIPLKFQNFQSICIRTAGRATPFCLSFRSVRHTTRRDETRRVSIWLLFQQISQDFPANQRKNIPRNDPILHEWRGHVYGKII